MTRVKLRWKYRIYEIWSRYFSCWRFGKKQWSKVYVFVLSHSEVERMSSSNLISHPTLVIRVCQWKNICFWFCFVFLFSDAHSSHLSWFQQLKSLKAQFRVPCCESWDYLAGRILWFDFPEWCFEVQTGTVSIFCWLQVCGDSFQHFIKKSQVCNKMVTFSTSGLCADWFWFYSIISFSMFRFAVIHRHFFFYLISDWKNTTHHLKPTDAQWLFSLSHFKLWEHRDSQFVLFFCTTMVKEFVSVDWFAHF